MASSDVVYWQCNKTLPQCMSYMLANQIMCDVTFLLGEERLEVHAHRYMLASRSPVFHAMFEGQMKEKGNIVIPDIAKDIFNVFLGYVYTDDVSLTVGNVIGVIYASKKYCVDLLTKQCKDFIKHIPHESVIKLMNNALKLQEEDIYKSCLERIKENAEACVNVNGFSSIRRKTLKAIIELDDITVKEENLYEQVMKWCNAECARRQLPVTWKNKRHLLGDMLYDIRFPLMDPKYFAEEIFEEELLTDKEKLEIMYYHSVQRSTSDKLFKSKRRCKVERVMRFSRNQRGTYKWNGQMSSLEFRTSHDSVIHGILVYGSASSPCTYEIKIRLRDPMGRLLSEIDTSTESNIDIEFHEVKFMEPVNIRARMDYCLELFMRGKDSKAGSNGQRTVYFGNEKKTATFMNSYPSSNRTNEGSGEIPGVLLT